VTNLKELPTLLRGLYRRIFRMPESRGAGLRDDCTAGVSYHVESIDCCHVQWSVRSSW